LGPSDAIDRSAGHPFPAQSSLSARSAADSIRAIEGVVSFPFPGPTNVYRTPPAPPHRASRRQAKAQAAQPLKTIREARYRRPCSD
jgi:hypothetical protein